jgi:hypothetical protein
VVEPGDEFYISDQGDGWWHCTSPLRAVILDGPTSLDDVRGYLGLQRLLVSVDPAIEWNGDPSYATRWGPEHPRCRPITPTSRLELLVPTGSFQAEIEDAWSIPAIPIAAEVGSQAPMASPALGAKVAISRSNTGA